MFKCISATRPSRSSRDVALTASDTTTTDNNYYVSSAIAVASCNVSFGERYDVKSVRNNYEGRSFRGWHHHVSVVLACYAFLVAEHARSFSPSAERTGQDGSHRHAA